MKNHIPIRMCIICKKRLEKHILKRFLLKDKKIYYNLAYGRSFYCCEECLKKDDLKSIQKAFKLKDIKLSLQDLKEIIANGKG